MNEELYTTEKPDRKDPSKMVTVTRYRPNLKDPPTGILYGKFRPLHRGHLLLLDELKKKGIKKFVIASPLRDDTRDNSANMFTTAEVDFLNEEIVKAFGFNVEFYRSKKIGPVQFTLANLVREGVAERPVLVAGQDRAPEYSKFTQPFNPKQVQDEKFEAVLVNVRFDGMSSSGVRELISKRNVKGLMAPPYKYHRR